MRSTPSSLFVAVLLIQIPWGSVVVGQNAKPAYPSPAMPTFRVDPRDFESSESDIRAICTATGRELWRYFPDYPLEPFIVTRGRQGPITLYQRNDQREIVLKLDTHGTLWSQFSYQFAHEFCHILSGYKNDFQGNQWFEETLCETASLFAQRAMAKSWKDSPPYANWKDYRDSLRDYADKVIRDRHHLREIHENGLPAFYRTHEAELRKTANNRELNGAIAVIFLHYFEAQPEHWEAIRWLNVAPAPDGESLTAYLTRWKTAAPERHREFITTLAKLLGIELTAPAGTSQEISSK